MFPGWFPAARATEHGLAYSSSDLDGRDGFEIGAAEKGLAGCGEARGGKTRARARLGGIHRVGCGSRVELGPRLTPLGRADDAVGLPSRIQFERETDRQAERQKQKQKQKQRHSWRAKCER